MKTAIGSVVAALAASACCLGPLVLSALGVGALGAVSTKLAPYRPGLLALTFVLLGAAFVVAYRPTPDACGAAGICRPSSRRTAKILLWAITALVVLIAAFPYYVNWLF